MKTSVQATPVETEARVEMGQTSTRVHADLAITAGTVRQVTTLLHTFPIILPQLYNRRACA